MFLLLAMALGIIAINKSSGLTNNAATPNQNNPNGAGVNPRQEYVGPPGPPPKPGMQWDPVGKEWLIPALGAGQFQGGYSREAWANANNPDGSLAPTAGSNANYSPDGTWLGFIGELPPATPKPNTGRGSSGTNTGMTDEEKARLGITIAQKAANIAAGLAGKYGSSTDKAAADDAAGYIGGAGDIAKGFLS